MAKSPSVQAAIDDDKAVMVEATKPDDIIGAEERNLGNFAPVGNLAAGVVLEGVAGSNSSGGGRALFGSSHHMEFVKFLSQSAVSTAAAATPTTTEDTPPLVGTLSRKRKLQTTASCDVTTGERRERETPEIMVNPYRTPESEGINYLQRFLCL